MAELSPQTLERLNKFRQSEKFSQLNSQTQARLSGFLDKNSNGLESLFKIVSTSYVDGMFYNNIYYKFNKTIYILEKGILIGDKNV